MDEIEVKATELKSKLEAIDAKFEEVKGLNEKLTELEGKVSAVVVKEDNAEITEVKSNIEKLNESINEINKKMVKQDVEVKATLEDSLRSVYESAEFKSQLQEVVEGKRQSTKAFEVKTDPSSVILSGITGDVTRTYPFGGVKGSLFEPNKFLANMNVVTIPQDKNRALWYDGTYYSNVGYMTELTAITTGDGAAVEEKTREIAKVGAKLPFSSEVVSDASYFINWAKNKGVESVLNKIDELIWGGVGADGGAYTKNIYGIKTQGSTAFNASTAGLALAIQDANIADVILAAATQIRISGKGQYMPKMVYMHPTDVTKLRSLKNKQADYINILPDGSLLVHGMVIMETAKVSANELLVATPETLQLHQKAGLETEIERVASTDSFVLYLRWRGQVVVPTTDILGNVYVSNITTAIAAISAGPATQNVKVVNTIAEPVVTYGITTTTTTTTTTTGA